MEQELNTALQPQKSDATRTTVTVIVAVLLTAIVVGGGVYLWLRSVNNQQIASLQGQITELQTQIATTQNNATPLPTTQAAPTAPVSSNAPILVADAKHEIALIQECGLALWYDKTKYSKPVKEVFKATAEVPQNIVSVTLGQAMPQSDVHIECRSNDTTSPHKNRMIVSVQEWLDTQSAGAQIVNKNEFSIFTPATLAAIEQLYNAKDRGYRQGSDTLGFQEGSWFYAISFKSDGAVKTTQDFKVHLNSLAPVQPTVSL